MAGDAVQPARARTALRRRRSRRRCARHPSGRRGRPGRHLLGQVARPRRPAGGARGRPARHGRRAVRRRRPAWRCRAARHNLGHRDLRARLRRYAVRRPHRRVLRSRDVAPAAGVPRGGARPDRGDSSGGVRARHRRGGALRGLAVDRSARGVRRRVRCRRFAGVRAPARDVELTPAVRTVGPEPTRSDPDPT